jgi:hypothetical protein
MIWAFGYAEALLMDRCKTARYQLRAAVAVQANIQLEVKGDQRSRGCI